MKILKSLLALVTLFALALFPSQGRAQTFTFSTLAGGTQGSNDGIGTNAEFNKPVGVAVDAMGDVFVADQLNNEIREMVPSGTNWIVTTIAGQPTNGSRDGTNTYAEFWGPTGIVIDANSNLYVADQFNQVIRKLTPEGTNWVVTTIAGQVRVMGTNDGANAQFFDPTGMAIDSASNLFVADEYNNAIREISPDGTNWVVSTIAGGTQGSLDGTNNGAEFYYPSGVAVDANDRVFVADQLNNLIRLITPDGTNWVVTTIAGQTIAGASNGLGTNALFNSPTGIATDTNGNVYVADLFNNAIRELTPAGSNWETTTIGGSLTNGFVDGVGTDAEFHQPYSLTADAYGDLFVADSANNAIRLGVSSSAAPDLGGLTVTITPGGAVTGGAEWQLDNGGLQASGTTVSGISPGTHTLTFNDVSGFTTPAAQPVTITGRQTNSITVNYTTAVANAGSLEVLISPADAVAAGAEWQVDGQSFETNGATVADLSVGSHILSFANVAGWITPSNQTVNITNAQTTLALATYVISNSVSTNGVGSLQVTILPSEVATNGGEWQVDGGALQTNGTTLTNLSAGTHIVSFSFVSGWLTPASQDVTITSSNLTTATGTYVIAPNFTVTVGAAPASDGTVTGGGTYPEGTVTNLTAIPNTGFEFIGWTGGATGTNNPLAVTVTGNLNITAYFAPVGSMEIILVTNGPGNNPGKITPNVAGKTLKQGTHYTLSAIPAAGNVFSGWTGSITTNKTPLKIQLESSIVLEANFIANPFIPLLGSYNGLFIPATNVTEQNAGMVKNLTVRTTGAYSATIMINGAGHGVTGSFDLAGQSTNVVKRPAAQGGNLTVQLSIENSTNPAPQVTGVVSGTTNGVAWSANLVADLKPATVRGTTNYTMLLEPDTNNNPPVLSPGGDGYAAIADVNGTARITGGLADGTAVSDSVPVSEDGYIPVYVNLYASKGLLLGWINLNSGVTNSVGLTWVHPPTKAGLFQNGFTNLLATNQILISPWTNPPANLGVFTNIQTLPTLVETNAATNFPASIASNGKITGSGVTGSLNLKTGVFTVTIDSNGTKTPAHGAILLNAMSGGGYIVNKTSAQAVLVQP